MSILNFPALAAVLLTALKPNFRLSTPHCRRGNSCQFFVLHVFSSKRYEDFVYIWVSFHELFSVAYFLLFYVTLGTKVMSLQALAQEKFWANKAECEDAEKAYYMRLSGAKVFWFESFYVRYVLCVAFSPILTRWKASESGLVSIFEIWHFEFHQFWLLKFLFITNCKIRLFWNLNLRWIFVQFCKILMSFILSLLETLELSDPCYVN